MKLFYINLWENNCTRAEALRSAQRTIRDRFNKGPRTPPWRWAGFMLTGDWMRVGER